MQLLTSAGCSSINLYSLLRYVDEHDLVRKLRGFDGLGAGLDEGDGDNDGDGDGEGDGEPLGSDKAREAGKRGLGGAFKVLSSSSMNGSKAEGSRRSSAQHSGAGDSSAVGRGGGGAVGPNSMQAVHAFLTALNNPDHSGQVLVKFGSDADTGTDSAAQES